MVISIFNTKGGVGKSTLATCLADIFSYSGSTCLVDLDHQGTLSRAAKLDSFDHQVKTVGKVQDISALHEQMVIVDCPPYLTKQTHQLLALSDFVLIPIKPGFADYFALADTLQYVKQANSRAAVILNMVRHGNKVTQHILELISESKMPILESQIKERVAYTRSLITGGAYELDSKAADELNRLATEIITKIQE